MPESKQGWVGVGLVIGASLTVWAPASALAAPVPDSHGCIGRWAGTGRNTGSSTEWTIDLTLASAPSGGRCGTIEYTNPACGGTLERCELVGSEIHTQEHYSHNDGSCAPAGRVIIRCDGDSLRYSWIGWERVNSTLHRVGGAPSSGTPPRPSTGQAPSTGPAPSAGQAPAPAHPTESRQPGPTPSSTGATPPNRSSSDSSRGGFFDEIGCSAITGALNATLVLPWILVGLRRRRNAA